MKKIIIYILFLVIIAPLVISCSDDDDKPSISNLAALGAKKQDQNKMYFTLNDISTLQLNLVAMPTGVEIPPVSYKSYQGYFTVSEDGLLTANTIGVDTLEINALDGSGLSVWYEIRITDHDVKVSSINIESSFLKTQLQKGQLINLADKITVNPANAINKSLGYESNNPQVIEVTKEGVVTAKGEIGDKAEITITALDGGGANLKISVEIVGEIEVYYDRSKWGVTSSQPFVKDNATGDVPAHLFDNDGKTFLSLYKNGKESTPEGVDIWITIDLGEKQKVEFFETTYRTNLTTDNLRLYTGTLLGSNDNATFTEIMPLEFTTGSDVNHFKVPEDKVGEYRYIRLKYDTWKTTGGNTMQFSEVKMGYIDKGKE